VTCVARSYITATLELFFRVIRHRPLALLLPPLLSSVDTKDTSRCIIRAKERASQRALLSRKRRNQRNQRDRGDRSSRNGHPARHRLPSVQNGQRSSKHNKPAANELPSLDSSGRLMTNLHRRLCVPAAAPPHSSKFLRLCRRALHADSATF
jgi:hypothetical protein